MTGIEPPTSSAPSISSNLWKYQAFLYARWARALIRLRRPSAKRAAELAWWYRKRAEERQLRHSHYEEFFTTRFGLDREFFASKRILDLGCGPRGSLEWADMAAERIGLDPLADDYRKLGTDRHKMTYVTSGVEQIPFPDSYFDVVTTFNSLDHVDDVHAAIGEITRVARSGATLLLITDVNHPPTPAEPQTFSWDIVEQFRCWRSEEVRRYERLPDGV